MGFSFFAQSALVALDFFNLVTGFCSPSEGALGGGILKGLKSIKTRNTLLSHHHRSSVNIGTLILLHPIPTI
jgi:hypothetical protein